MAAGNDVNIRIGVEGADQAAKQVSGMSNAVKGLGGQQAQEAARGISAMGSAVGMFNAQAGSAISLVGHLAGSIRAMTKAMLAMIATPVGMALAAITAVVALLVKGFNDAKKAAQDARDAFDWKQQMGAALRNKELGKTFDELGRKIEDAEDKLKHFYEMRGIEKNNSRSTADAQAELEKQMKLAGARNDQERQDIERQYGNNKAVTGIERSRQDAQEEASRVWNDAEERKYNDQLKRLQAQLAKAQQDKDAAVQEHRVHVNRGLGKKDDGSDYTDVFKAGQLDEEARKAEAKWTEQSFKDPNSKMNVAIKAVADAENEIAKLEREKKQKIEKQAKLQDGILAYDIQIEAEKKRQATEEARIAEKRQEERDAFEYGVKMRNEGIAEAEQTAQDQKEMNGATTDAAKRKIVQERLQKAQEAEAEAREREERLIAERRQADANGGMDEKRKIDWEREYAKAKADRDKAAGNRRGYDLQLDSMDRAQAERNRDRMTQIAGLERGSGNRLTAMGLGSGGIAAGRWNESTAKNTEKMAKAQERTNSVLERIANNQNNTAVISA